MIRITCPCCGAGLKAEDRLIGQTIRCPKCLSVTKVSRPKEEDLAKPVETNYEPQKHEEDHPRDKDCPKCGGHIPAGEYLCKKCGYHVKLEAYFEDLTEEALARGTEPKTKMEHWFEEQLHELASPRDVLIASAFCLVFLAVVDVIVGRIFFGPLPGTIVGLIVAGMMTFGWYVLMQRLGILNDPKREVRLQKEHQDREANVSRDPGQGRGAGETIAKPITERGMAMATSGAAASKGLALPDEEFDVDDIDLFDDRPAKPKPKPSKPQPPAAKPPNAAKPQSPARPQPKAQPPAKSEEPASNTTSSANKPKPQPSPQKNDDDWLNDLL